MDNIISICYFYELQFSATHYTIYMNEKKRKAKKKTSHAFLLRLDKRLKVPLEELSDENRRSVNDEINLAVEQRLIANKKLEPAQE